MYAADVDGDDDQDILVASYDDDTISWHENLDGQGNFGPSQVISTDADGARSVYATDLDGDGDVDVVSASGLGNKIAWYENTDGKGAFGSEQVLTTETLGPWSVYAADLNGDGMSDVLSASYDDNKIAWYPNTGQGNFDDQEVVSLGIRGAIGVRAADLDGDGDLDILAAGYGSNRLVWFANLDGQGDFGPAELISDRLIGGYFTDAADIDGDGDLDVLATAYGGDQVVWYANTDGQGTFSSEQLIAAPANGVTTAQAADLDGDGRLDVLSALFAADEVVWQKNLDGLGDFAPPQPIVVQADRPYTVYAADLDGDGDTDIVSAARLGNEVMWFTNSDGKGTFTKQIISTEVLRPFCVFAADIDSDGDLDVLSASSLDNKIAWYQNTDGVGTFGPQRVITTDAISARAVYAADLDSDGDLDVLSASLNDDKIAWYQNIDGAGTFGPQQVITTETDGARSVFAADLDGDGDNDVLSASSTDDKILWFQNTNNNGSFGPPLIISAETDGARWVFAADVDGDGDLDVLTAASSGVLAWYANVDGLGSFGTAQIITNDADSAGPFMRSTSTRTVTWTCCRRRQVTTKLPGTKTSTASVLSVRRS